MATMTKNVDQFAGSGFERAMEWWRHVIQVAERTLVDNVAATVPWLAPISPAYMAWHNAVALLGWPQWVAWMVALAIEGLGLSVISTAFQLWRDGRKSFWVAVVTTIFYLGVVITVNVALELGAPVWIAKALLSLLSVPAAVTIALRTQNAQMLEKEQMAMTTQAEIKLASEAQAKADALAAEEREHKRQVDAEERERAFELKKLKLEKVSESGGKVSASGAKVAESQPERPETYGKWDDWRDVPTSERQKIAQMTIKEVMNTYGKSEKTAGNWVRNAQKEFGG